MKAKVLILALLAGLNILMRYSSLPVFELDEANYAYIADRTGQGDVAYRDIFDQKPPIVYYIYSLSFKLFGKDIKSPRIFALFYTSLTIIFLFLLAEKLLGKKAAYLSGIIYTLFSNSLSVQGTGANTEVFFVLPVVISLYILLFALENSSLRLFFLFGLFSGLAFMTKHTAIMNFLAGIAYSLCVIARRSQQRPTWQSDTAVSLRATEKECGNLIINASREIASGDSNLLRNDSRGPFFSKLLISSFGFMLPLFLFMLYFLSKGALNDFLYDNFYFNFLYSYAFSTRLLLHFGREVLAGIFLPVLLSVFFIFRFSQKGIKVFSSAPRVRDSALTEAGLKPLLQNIQQAELLPGIFISLQIFFSLAGISVGTRFYPHYFIQAIPFLAMASAVVLSGVKPYFYLLLLLSPPVLDFKYHFLSKPGEIYFRQYKNFDYEAAHFISEYVRVNTNAGDSIYVWNRFSFPCFLAGRKCATRYVFFPGLYTKKIVEKVAPKYMSDLKKNRPALIIIYEDLNPNAVSFNSFIEKNYRLKETLIFRKQGYEKKIPVMIPIKPADNKAP